MDGPRQETETPGTGAEFEVVNLARGGKRAELLPEYERLFPLLVRAQREDFFYAPMRLETISPRDLYYMRRYFVVLGGRLGGFPGGSPGSSPDGEYVGFATVHVTPKHGTTPGHTFGGAYLLPGKARRRGFGMRLFTAVDRVAREFVEQSVVSRSVMTTAGRNVAVQKILERLGYMLIDRHAGAMQYRGRLDEKLVYEKRAWGTREVTEVN